MLIGENVDVAVEAEALRAVVPATILVSEKKPVAASAAAPANAHIGHPSVHEIPRHTERSPRGKIHVAKPRHQGLVTFTTLPRTATTAPRFGELAYQPWSCLRLISWPCTAG